MSIVLSLSLLFGSLMRVPFSNARAGAAPRDIASFARERCVARWAKRASRETAPKIKIGEAGAIRGPTGPHPRPRHHSAAVLAEDVLREVHGTCPHIRPHVSRTSDRARVVRGRHRVNSIDQSTFKTSSPRSP